MDIDLQNLFESLYTSDIYATNRLLLDFPDYLIEGLEKSRKYPNLFTTTLQNDLYREKVKRLDLSTKIFDNIIEFQKRTGISWRKIYNIALIMSDEENDQYQYPLFNSIFKNDDVSAYQIAELINSKVASYHWVKAIQHLYQHVWHPILNSKKILLHIASTENIRINSRVFIHICLGAGQSSPNDIEYIKLFTQTLFNHMKSIDPTFSEVGENHAKFLIYSHIKDGIMDADFRSKDVIDFFLNKGVIFSESEISKIGRKFGKEYADDVNVRSNQNERVIAT